jgi:TIR domain
MRMPLPGFISYAHADHKAVATLQTHLRATERLLDVSFWMDVRKLHGGDYWDASIQKAISAAQVHLLLMSPSFLASDYIYDHELPAIRSKLAGGGLVVPVVIKECYWQSLGPLQAVPTDKKGGVKPVTDWAKESGFHRANMQIIEAIQAHFGFTPKKLF